MAISKIRFEFPSGNTYTILEKLSIYYNEDGVETKFNPGKKISNTETENVIAKGLKAGSDLTKPLLNYHILENGCNSYIEYIFKDPLPNICRLSYDTMSTSSIYVKKMYIHVYDEDGNKVYYNTSSPLSRSSGELVSLLTPEIESTKVYNIDKVGYIETTDQSHFTDVYKFKSISIDMTEHENITKCRFLVSFDGRQTYKTYDINSNQWIECNKEELIEKGMTKEFIESEGIDFINECLDNTTLDFMIGLQSTDVTKTPSIRSISAVYLKIYTE